MEITTKTVNYSRAFVYVNGECVALMERSPWTGEWCYGLVTKIPNKPGLWFDSPFNITERKTVKAAAKIAVAAHIHGK